MKNEIGDINEVIIRFLDGTATCEEKVFSFELAETIGKEPERVFRSS